MFDVPRKGVDGKQLDYMATLQGMKRRWFGLEADRRLRKRIIKKLEKDWKVISSRI